MSEGLRNACTRRRLAIRFGTLLLFAPLLVLPLEYWYVYHYAPDLMVIPSRGRAYQKIHLDIVFDFLIFLTEIIFAMPGAILLGVANFKNVAIRFLILPTVFVGMFILLAIETGSLWRAWPNPVFPSDAVKAYHEELKAADDAFNNERKASNEESSMIR